MSDQSMPTAAELRDEMREELGRLRAANADLLDACEAALDYIDPEDAPNTYEALRLAVARAKGAPA